MKYKTDDLRISGLQEVIPPEELHKEYPLSDKASDTIHHARQTIHDILNGDNDRLLVIVGPCSIHDPKAAREYAERLKLLKDELADDFHRLRNGADRCRIRFSCCCMPVLCTTQVSRLGG